MNKEIKKVLDEHLSAINGNTTEIQALFDYLQELETKNENLTKRLEELQLSQGQIIEKPIISPLNKVERKIFLILYTEEIPLSYKEIAIKAELPLALVPECISTLINKGIPFKRSLYNDKLFLKLDPEFKELQAKENLVNLNLQSFME